MKPRMLPGSNQLSAIHWILEIWRSLAKGTLKAELTTQPLEGGGGRVRVSRRETRAEHCQRAAWAALSGGYR
jgi:hypothetical protein